MAKIRRSEGTISASYLWLLRKGVKDNPTKRHLEALARCFGVPPAYFFDEALTEQRAADLALLAALRDADVRAVALHAQRLSLLGRRALVTLAEQLAQIDHRSSGDGVMPARKSRRTVSTSGARRGGDPASGAGDEIPAGSIIRRLWSQIQSRRPSATSRPRRRSPATGAGPE